MTERSRTQGKVVSHLRCRSYGAKRWWDAVGYKDFAPTEHVPLCDLLLSFVQFKSLAAAGPSTTGDAHTNLGRAFFLELPHRHLPSSQQL
jgi:hypothetical protein